jgi:release factor H-coupled RctB family protein
MVNDIVATRGPKVRVVASASTWIEGEALRQLDATAQMDGMRLAVGMPDLHPGKGSPVGAAFLSEGVIHPALVGSDIGCGMALHVTSMPIRKIRPDRIAERLNGLDLPWPGDTAEWLGAEGARSTPFDDALGTPGRGNHFLEAQKVHEILDRTVFDALGLDDERLHLLVHSGSRGLGDHILRKHSAKHGSSAVTVPGDGDAYITEHDQAVAWARANRSLCAHRALAALGIEGKRVLDICHNSVTTARIDGCTFWLHRKGAAPADVGPVVIPGSRGDLSFVVMPMPDTSRSLWSLAHGAGRKIARHEARGKLREFYRREDLDRTIFGGRVVCGDEVLLWEEAPECYKDVAGVVDDLVAAGLVSIVASFEPVVTFKTSVGARVEERERRKDWKMNRRQAREAKWGAR